MTRALEPAIVGSVAVNAAATGGGTCGDGEGLPRHGRFSKVHYIMRLLGGGSRRQGRLPVRDRLWPAPVRRLSAGAGPVVCVLAVWLLALTGPAAPDPRAAVVTSGFQESVIFCGLTNPTAVRFASDGRVFVAEKSGLIKVFDGLSDTTPTVFADLNVNVYNYWDRGLLGLALHPNFPRPLRLRPLHVRRADRRHRAAVGDPRRPLRSVPDPAGTERPTAASQRPGFRLPSLGTR